MTDIFKDFEDIVDKEKSEPKEFDLGPISVLGDKQAALEEKVNDNRVELIKKFCDEIGASIADIDEVLKMFKKDLFNVRQVQIPELMVEFNLESITTSSGVKLTIKDDINVTTKDKEALYAFMRSTGSADLIKNRITVEIQNEKQRKEAIDLLDKTELAYQSDESVHFQTLKKFVKDQLAAGKVLPNKAVSVFEYRYTKIKR